ncbi:hypothetical protein [Xenorhabdus lircayensis]|uniref:Uncharacterized protein n=1 Tax=Xenorhabdus lircayensis TaxID=2763499 RepID=A0ABS0UAY2_9GAMM|nr:hypothetical protein [Xenorhabdus lircayensis]MBI6550103.1 hypothetical protein [Xenorhabdus lircayensis]
MKKSIVVSALTTGLLFCSLAQAESKTISLGYAHIKPQDEKALKDAILNYRYELNNEWGILSSFTEDDGDNAIEQGEVIQKRISMGNYSCLPEYLVWPIPHK